MSSPHLRQQVLPVCLQCEFAVYNVGFIRMLAVFVEIIKVKKEAYLKIKCFKTMRLLDVQEAVVKKRQFFLTTSFKSLRTFHCTIPVKKYDIR